MGDAALLRNDARIRIHLEIDDDDNLTVSILDSGLGVMKWVREDQSQAVASP